MKITAVKNQFNTFNIESISAARIIAIKNGLRRLRDENELSVPGTQLLEMIEASEAIYLKMNN